MKTKIYLFSLLFLAAILCLPFRAYSQVTVGTAEPPRSFSVLEVESNNERGLRLPQMTTAERTALQATFGAEANGAARGLQIFNTETRCVDIWGGTDRDWISLCGARLHCGLIIAEHIPASLTATVTTTANPALSVRATSTGTRTYQWFRNTTGVVGSGSTQVGTNSPSLTGQTGLTVAGSPHFFYVVVTATCSGGLTSTVTSEVFRVDVINLGGILAGTGRIDGRTCFDVGQTVCGDIAPANRQTTNFTNRTPQAVGAPAPFSGVQTYTFTAAGTITNVRFLIEDLDNVLAPATLFGGNLAASMVNNQTVTLPLVHFQGDLNTRFSGQLSTAPRAVIHIIFTIAGGQERRVSRNIRMFDCACCGAYHSISGTNTVAEWRRWMCHNVGADITRDPFTPSAHIHGAMFKWGTGIVALSQEDHIMTQTDAQILARTGIAWANRGGDPPADTTWPVAASPCPPGFRIADFWRDYVSICTQQNGVGTRVGPSNQENAPYPDGNFDSGFRFGNYLFFPAAGGRNGLGTATGRGWTVNLWTGGPGLRGTPITINDSTFAANLHWGVGAGVPIRCVAN